MRDEKKYIVTESQLLNLLIAEMKNVMNERAGVDNWEWYGSAYEEVINEYYPDDDVPEEITVWDCAKARIEAGEFPEQMDIQEFLGNIFVDMELSDDYESMN